MATNLTQMKYNPSQNNWLVFVVFLIYDFHRSFAAPSYFVARRRNHSISCFQIDFIRVLRFYFSLFSQTLAVTRMKFGFIWFRFVLIKSVINSLSQSQFSLLPWDILSCGKENVISCFSSVSYIRLSSFC